MTLWAEHNYWSDHLTPETVLWTVIIEKVKSKCVVKDLSGIG